MSSPARPVRFDNAIHSSSPDLPSLIDIFRKSPQKAPPLRTGSNATPMPTVARSTFTTAVNLLREAPEIDIETEQIAYSPPRKTKPVRKRVKSQAANDIEKELTKKTSSPIEIASSPQEKPWQKFKNISDSRHKTTHGDETQSELPKGRARKPAVKDKAAKKKHTENVSRHISKPEQKKKWSPVTGEEICGLQEAAMARRNDWTPPPEDQAEILGSESDTREITSPSRIAAVSKDIFSNLYDTYACKDSEKCSPGPSSAQSGEPVADVLGKRKRLDMILTGNNKPPRETSPKKVSAIKKKTRTITELATAPYAVPEIDLLAPGTKESLLNYFDSDGAVKALVEHQSALMDFKANQPKKPAVKPRKTKKKTGTVEQPILLSPSTALKTSRSQDFVFGTSSQLVLEESPTALRDLQMAIQASNQIDQDDPFVSSPALRATNKTGLWNAGSRDRNGELLNVELADLVDASAASISGESAPNEIDRPVSDKFPDNNDLDLGLSGSPAASPLPYSDGFIDINEIDLDYPHVTHVKKADPSSKPSLPSGTLSDASVSSITEMASTPRPNYELFTDVQLAKKITSFGFKAVKKRQAMIALLDQCWESQHPQISRVESSTRVATMSTSAASSAQVNTCLKKQQTAAAPIATAELARKPRGRPRKDTRATTSPSSKTTKTKPKPKAKATLAVKSSPKKPSAQSRDDSINTANSAWLTSPKAAASIIDTFEAPAPATLSRRKKPKQKVIEIMDSEDEAHLSPSPQTSPNQLFSSPPPLDLSISEVVDADMSLSLLDPAPGSNDATASQTQELSAYITKAIKSAPRSKDPTSPSWHEKMLLYDPIVLEELAAWLNSGELTRVGYDGEVSPGDVKKWCEAKSVICLWQVNLHGKERKRY